MPRIYRVISSPRTYEVSAQPSNATNQAGGAGENASRSDSATDKLAKSFSPNWLAKWVNDRLNELGIIWPGSGTNATKQ